MKYKFFSCKSSDVDPASITMLYFRVPEKGPYRPCNDSFRLSIDDTTGKTIVTTSWWSAEQLIADGCKEITEKEFFIAITGVIIP